jgi:hypothetical protein
MKLFYLSLLFILHVTRLTAPADPADNVADLIRQGNIHELSKLFASNIEIALPGDENVYSKAQAELILDKFFDQNKPRAVKMLHKVNSNPNYYFGVLIVNTSGGPFRVAYTMKGTNGNFLLIEMRVEAEKVK